MKQTEYQPLQEKPTMVSEPIAAYGLSHHTNAPRTFTDNYDNRNVDYSTMPCIYTDEEFEEIVRLSELDSPSSDEEIRTLFAKAGIVWNL